MTFWTSESIKSAGFDLIDRYDEKRVKECAYDLSLGREAYVTPGAASPANLHSTGKRQHLALGEQLVIPPGQFALLLTEETVTIPPHAIGFISVKSKFKLHGLVNVSGFHVDPGFSGKLIFSVYNAGGKDFFISRGEPLFLLWVASLEHETCGTFSKDAPRQHQDKIPDNDIMSLGRPQFSPATMDQRLTDLEARQRTTSGIIVSLFVAIVAGLGLFFLQRAVEGGGQTDSAPRPPITSPASEEGSLLHD